MSCRRGRWRLARTPRRAPLGELEEETGYQAATITPLCRFYTSPGLSNELMWAYAATGLRHVGQRLEADEQIVVHPMPVSAAMGLIDSGSWSMERAFSRWCWHRSAGCCVERGTSRINWFLGWVGQNAARVRGVGSNEGHRAAWCRPRIARVS